jgi:2-polyprenyl-3-methyl-5-hydroxy-6-metoxy-1,4-benzoquinol methylase
MLNKEVIESSLRDINQQFGTWSSDIPLPHGVWTRGNQKTPHTRLKRIIQIAQDLCAKPLSQCRVLDLGCLDGMFSIEFALHGAETVGVEIRESNIRKAIFCQETLGLKNLSFRQGDVRHISEANHGRFDIIVCSGIFYHLTAEDAFKLVSSMFSMTDKLVIIDTHIALQSREKAILAGNEYFGYSCREHGKNATQAQKSRRPWASWDNPTSFWFTRPSLINMLNRAGFSSVYENFVPLHKNYGNPGLECVDRCTFVAVKSQRCTLLTSPAANNLEEAWPEYSLSYSANGRRVRLLFDRILSAFKRL